MTVYGSVVNYRYTLSPSVFSYSGPVSSREFDRSLSLSCLEQSLKKPFGKFYEYNRVRIKSLSKQVKQLPVFCLCHVLNLLLIKEVKVTPKRNKSG